MENKVKKTRKKSVMDKLRKIPIPPYRAMPEDRAQLANALLAWSRDDTTMGYTITHFCDDYGIKPERFYDWCKEDLELDAARKTASRTLARRIMQGALNKDFDSNTGRFLYSNLDSEFKQWRKEEAAERAGLEQQGQVLRLYINDFEATDQPQLTTTPIVEELES